LNENDDCLPFPGKIAIITNTITNGEDDFHSAEQLVAKYGPDKIVHVTWPDNFLAEKGRMINTVASLTDDREIRVMIINQAIPGTNDAVDMFKGIRNDVFILYCLVHESFTESAKRANLILMPDELGMGSEMVKQAKKQGTKAFIHYSFPRHMAHPHLAGCRDLAKETCAAEDIQFVEVTVPDPAGEAGVSGARQFIMEDVPRMVAKYGEDTAFFCTNCSLQATLIKSVVDCHAIYPQPCCPSPLHGFPEALGIELGDGFPNLSYVIGEASSIAAEKNMTDRLSTWPVSSSMMCANAGAEYAIKWINGLVPKLAIDDRTLTDCMSDYIKELVDENIEVSMTSYSDGNKTYDNFKLLLMGYLDY